MEIDAWVGETRIPDVGSRQPHTPAACPPDQSARGTSSLNCLKISSRPPSSQVTTPLQGGGLAERSGREQSPGQWAVGTREPTPMLHVDSGHLQVARYLLKVPWSAQLQGGTSPGMPLTMPLSSATVQCTKLFAVASTPFPASDRRARHDGTRSFSSTVLCTPYSVVTCSNIGAGSVLINLSRACSTPFSTALPESGKPFVKSHSWSCPISGAFLALWPGRGKPRQS